MVSPHIKSLPVVLLTAVILAALILAYHSLAIAGVLHKGSGESQSKTSIVQLEEFAFDSKTDHAPPIVAIGSSRLANVIASSLDWHVGNLCIPAHSSLDGALVLHHLRYYPKIVLIEASPTLCLAGSELPKQTLPNWRLALMQFSPIFRTSYQPSSVIQLPLPVQKNFWAERNVDLINLTRKERETEEPDCKTLAKNLGILKPIVDDLQSRGTQVYFVDVPADNIVLKSKMEVLPRKMIRSIFPLPQYKWIEDDGNKVWDTTDGVHLTTEGAKEFAATIQAAMTQ